MEEREQLIRRGYGGLGDGDLDAVMAMCHDDVVWDWSRSLAPFAGVYHGREGLRALYDSFMLAAASVTFHVEEVEVVGEHLIAHIRVDVRGVSGAEGSARSPNVLTFDGGLIRRHTLFQERAAALAEITTRAPRADPAA
jgi:ketosteroid isomerase-like protein